MKKKIKPFQSKKAFIASTLVTFWAYLLFILVIILFYWLFAISQDSIALTVNSYSEESLSQLSLINNLKQPITLNKKTTSLSEWIIEAEHNDNTRLLLKDQIENNLKIYNTIEIEFTEETIINTDTPKYYLIPIDSLYLPTPSHNIKINLYKENENELLYSEVMGP